MKKIESCNIHAKVVGCKRLITACKPHSPARGTTQGYESLHANRCTSAYEHTHTKKKSQKYERNYLPSLQESI